jgi:hypothetical protein
MPAGIAPPRDNTESSALRVGFGLLAVRYVERCRAKGERMIRLIDDLPDTVLGVEAVGRVEASDYETVLDPAVKAHLERNGEVRLLYVLGEQFEGYATGAALEDAKLGLENWSSWERVAVVTDRDWLHDALRMLGWMFPGEVRAFRLAEREDAVAWVAA